MELQRQHAAKSQPVAVGDDVFLSLPFARVAERHAAADEEGSGGLPPTAARRWPVRTFRALVSATQWAFGVLTLIIGLAFLATIPILQLMSLGYLLEVSGRVTRSGRLRDAFVGVRKAARIGGWVLGSWLMLVPLRVVSSLWYDAQQIDPGGPVAAKWRVGLLVLTVLTVVHLMWAWYRGGKLRHFFWPAPVLFVRRLRSGFQYCEARGGLWRFFVSLRLAYYFRLGFQGFIGAMAWLLVPLLLLVGSTRLSGGGAAVIGLLGALLLATVLLYLPFLQAQLAAERRLVAMFQWTQVREQFRRAPLAYWFALLVTLMFAVPLYLLKIETVPQQITWIPSLFFVVFIFPARAVTGWALGRARRCEQPRHFLFRILARLAAIPVVAFYVLIVYFTQFISWNGAWNVFEQHAFLVPVPFLGL